MIPSGIKVAQTPGANIHDNSITNMKKGVSSYGNLLNTQFYCNALEYVNTGFYFADDDGLTVATTLSDQNHGAGLGVLYASDNTWGNVVDDENYRIEGDVDEIDVKWYYRDKINEDRFRPQPDGTNFNSNVIPTIVDDPYYPECEDIEIDYGLLKREKLLSRVVNEETNYINLAEEMERRDNQFVYNHLADNPDWLTLGEDDAIYQSYFDVMQISNIGISREVSSLMDQELWEQALVLNDQIVGNQLADYNEKMVNELYMTKYQYDSIPLSYGDSMLLTDIALLTPYIGGEAVYSARIMMNLEISDYSGIEYRTDGSNIEMIENPNFIIYPNPASDILTIKYAEYDLKEVNCKLIIKDVSNRVIFSRELSNLKENIDVSSWKQGVYFYCILGANNSEQGKFIIIH